MCHHHHWTPSLSFSAPFSVMLNQAFTPENKRDTSPEDALPVVTTSSAVIWFIVAQAVQTQTHTEMLTRRESTCRVTCLGYSSLKCSSPTEAVMSPVKVLLECGNLLCSPSVGFFQCLLKHSEHHLTYMCPFLWAVTAAAVRGADQILEWCS